MKTFAVKAKHAGPSIGRSLPSRFGYRGPEVKAQQAEIHRILHATSAQPKLTIGQPNDKYEQEADSVADQVMAMPETAVRQRSCTLCQEKEIQTRPLYKMITPILQRQKIQRQLWPSFDLSSEHKEEPAVIQRQAESSFDEAPKDEKEDPVRTKRNDSSSDTASPALENSIKQSRGQGTALPDNTLSFMGNRFGTNFNHVRIYNDSNAIQLNRHLNSQAFARGSDIYFNSGRYNPESSQGKSLLAHELTHVIQQSASPTLQKLDDRYIQRQADITKAPSGLPCVLKTGTGHTPGVDVLFPLGKNTISPADKTRLAAFAATWIVSASGGMVFVDGFASTDGAQSTNWRLSCARAQTVKAELVKNHIPSSSIITIAHGESTEFSTSVEKDNRRVVVSSLSTPSPPAVPLPVPPQPAPLPLKSIKFTSDHNMLKDNNANWSNTGAVLEPEWITNPLRNKAISHTKNTRLVADVTVSVSPAGTAFDLIGTGISGTDTSFKKTGNTATGADQVITITADANLPNAVSQLYRYIVWKTKAGNKEQLVGFSGPHKIFVTYGTPSGGVTEKRMAWSCQKANAQDTPAKIADKIGPKATSSSHFGSNFNLSNPWTALTSNGDCGTLSTLMKQALEMLGVTGAEIRFVYARRSSWTNLWTTNTWSNETSGGHKLGFISGAWNNYEGTCFFNSKWWMGGAGAYKWTALGVLKRWTWPNTSSIGQRQVWENNQNTPVPYYNRSHVLVAT